VFVAEEVELRRRLARIDGRGYKAYKEIQGQYTFGQFALFVDHVQGDPFAAPSRLRVRVPQTTAGSLPDTNMRKKRRKLMDFLIKASSHGYNLRKVGIGCCI
jgi:predicted ABC-class ATPase